LSGKKPRLGLIGWKSPLIVVARCPNHSPPEMVMRRGAVRDSVSMIAVQI